MEGVKNMVEHIVDDETDEFEVISREDDQEEGCQLHGVAYTQTHDEASTVCDDEVGLDRVSDSTVPSRCDSLMCSFAPFGTENPLQYEKFLDAVKEENEKNRNVLEQIASMVAQLTKEKSDNTELRAKILVYETQIKKLEEECLKWNIKDLDRDNLAEKLKIQTGKLNEAVAQNARKDARIAELNTIISEKDLRIVSLEQESHTAAACPSETASNEEILEKLKRENASQAEIIRLLNEELNESERMLAKTKQDYREKLDEISEQWERSYRAEVNH